MASKSTITDALYATVEKAVASKENQQSIKNGIDRYLARNTDRYFIAGPADRPLFSLSDGDVLIQSCGLTRQQVTTTLKNSKNVGSSWNIMNDPVNTVDALLTRFALIKKNDIMLESAKQYIVVAMYPSLHYKYFKHGTNEACMQYTIMNLSNKYIIKNSKNLWDAFMTMMVPAIELHKDRLIKGDDTDYIGYIQDVHTRMNSLLKNVATEYYANYENQRYLETEYENFDSDSYHEAESSSQDIARISENVMNYLIMHGPDMALVKLAATSCQVSVNELRTHMINLINRDHSSDIYEMIEAILFLYLFNDDGEHHSVSDIKSNEFTTYCLKTYKRSNTTNKNIVKIKSILDKWIKETGIDKTTGRPATILNYKKSFYNFIVFTIQKYGR